MKIKLLIAAGCFMILTSCATCNSGCNTCDAGDCPNMPSYSVTTACGGGGFYRGNCSCSDPNCGTNPCLSCGRCCAAFGNAGAYIPTGG